MKTLKAMSILLFLCMLSSVNAAAQKESSMMDKLTATVWKPAIYMSREDSYFSLTKYDKTFEYEKSYDDDDVLIIESARFYYLSDTPDKEFDESKVGKAANGKYMVTRNVGTKNIVKIMAYEIISITDTKMSLKILGDFTGGSADNFLIREYVAVKEDPWKDAQGNMVRPFPPGEGGVKTHVDIEQHFKQKYLKRMEQNKDK